MHPYIYSLSIIHLSTDLPIYLPFFLPFYYLSIFLSTYHLFTYISIVCLSVCLLNTLGYCLAQKQPGSGQWFREQNVPAQG